VIRAMDCDNSPEEKSAIANAKLTFRKVCFSARRKNSENYKKVPCIHDYRKGGRVKVLNWQIYIYILTEEKFEREKIFIVGTEKGCTKYWIVVNQENSPDYSWTPHENKTFRPYRFSSTTNLKPTFMLRVCFHSALSRLLGLNGSRQVHRR